MKKTLLTLIAIAALFVAGSSYASSVTNIELTYQDGFTVAKVNVDGIVKFTHQTVEAKDGRPFRVILDLLKANHQLGAQKFTALPKCPVTAIRTSQFTVEPEKVVRIVFDMDNESVYRVESSENNVSVFFSDNNTTPFTGWSSGADVKTRKNNPQVTTETPKLAAKGNWKDDARNTPAEINNTIDEDRMLALSNESTKEPVKTKKTAHNVYSASDIARNYSEAPASTPAKPVQKVKVETKVDEAKQAKPVPQVKPKVTVSKVTETPAKSKKVAKPVVKKTKPVTVDKTKPVAKKTKPVTVAKNESKKAKKAKKPEAKTSKAADSKPTAETAKVDKVETNKKSASRFRRSSNKSARVKGTLVAEFPKRLVIKYDAAKYRDPFETLINEAKTHNNPIEKRIPNVEGLKLVGIIESGGNNNRALFEDTDGYGYILKTGDKVKKGYVLRVENERVYFQIFEYGWSRTVALNLES